MSVPNFADLAASIFHAFPADIAALRAACDRTDAIRNQNPSDPRVADGETFVNNLKGLFTRRIAWACHQQDPRIGLRLKVSGQHATRPSDGLMHSTDALMLRDSGQIIDVMSDRDVSWNWVEGDTQPLDQWVAPLPEDVVVLDPPPPPPPPHDDPPPVNVVAMMLAQYAEIAQALARLDDRVAALAAKPDPVLTVPPITFPSYEAKNRYLGTITLTPKA